MAKETRKSKRAPAALRVRFRAATVEQFIDQQKTNLSSGGIFIRSKSPLHRGTLMVFDFQLQDGSPLIKGVGRVVWARKPEAAKGDEPPGMGIKFIRVEPESLATFQKIMAGKRASEESKDVVVSLSGSQSSPGLRDSQAGRRSMARPGTSSPPPPPPSGAGSPSPPEPSDIGVESAHDREPSLEFSDDEELPRHEPEPKRPSQRPTPSAPMTSDQPAPQAPPQRPRAEKTHSTPPPPPPVPVEGAPRTGRKKSSTIKVMVPPPAERPPEPLGDPFEQQPEAATSQPISAEDLDSLDELNVEPTEPEPAEPEPAEPEPVEPEPAEPVPVDLEPADLEPAEPEPAEPERTGASSEQAATFAPIDLPPPEQPPAPGATAPIEPPAGIAPKGEGASPFAHVEQPPIEPAPEPEGAPPFAPIEQPPAEPAAESERPSPFAPIEAPAAARPSPPAPPQAAPADSAPQTPPAAQPAQPFVSAVEPQDKKSKGKLIATIIVLFVLLGVLGVASWYLYTLITAPDESEPLSQGSPTQPETTDQPTSPGGDQAAVQPSEPVAPAPAATTGDAAPAEEPPPAEEPGEEPPAVPAGAERVLIITSTPSNTPVSINHQIVGRTPVTVTNEDVRLDRPLDLRLSRRGHHNWDATIQPTDPRWRSEGGQQRLELNVEMEPHGGRRRELAPGETPETPPPGAEPAPPPAPPAPAPEE